MNVITHILANIRSYATMVVLVGGAVIAQGVLHGTVAADVTTVVAIAAAIATPAPASGKVTADTARRSQ